MYKFCIVHTLFERNRFLSRFRTDQPYSVLSSLNLCIPTPKANCAFQPYVSGTPGVTISSSPQCLVRYRPHFAVLVFMFVRRIPRMFN